MLCLKSSECGLMPCVRTYMLLVMPRLARKNNRTLALKDLIAKYSTREAFLVASVYAFRNQRNEAFEWLDRAYAQHEDSLADTNLPPMLKNLHKDPRYNAFLKKIHLPTT
jgi:hypothetical protein